MAEQEADRGLINLSIVLPIYKTADCLEELHARLCTTLESQQLSFELIMVDDGSPDGAHLKLEELARKDTRIKALFLSRNYGQHPAICAALEHAGGNVIVLMDADLQDRPEDIPLLLSHLKPEVDIVYTVKSNSSDGALTRLTSRFYHYIFSSITRTKVPSNIGTFRLFRQSVLRSLLLFSERNILYGPLMFYIGYKAVTVPVSHQVRNTGRSAYTFRKRLALAINSLISYTDIPHRVLIGSGSLVLGISIIYSLVLLGSYFLVDSRPPPGLTLLALLITASLGATMFALGIIGAYIFRVYQEVLARPRYLLSRTMNVDRDLLARKSFPLQETGHAVGHHSSQH